MLDKIKAMREMTEKMAEMEKSVLDECKKDRKQLRYDGLCKIFDYLDEIANSLNGELIRIKLKERQLFGFQDWTYIHFNSKYVTHRSSTYNETKSDYKILWHIEGHGSKNDEGRRYNFIDRGNLEELCPNGTWLDGYITLLENWKDIKSQIENGIMEHYDSKMKRIRENAQKNLEAYEKAANFEI